MNLEYINNGSGFWWILGLAGIVSLLIFIIWAISQVRNKTK